MLIGGYLDSYGKNRGDTYVRATRRVSFATTVGQGNNTVGYWLGTAGDGTSKLIAAPKSTELGPIAWGSYGTARGTTSITDGVTNTATLFGFGSAAHPAAYYCKILTTGGYNTWYLPAKNELTTLYSNKSATPFATANGLFPDGTWSSTEVDANTAATQGMGNGAFRNFSKSRGEYYARAVRRV
jgi:hypothetical protein